MQTLRSLPIFITSQNIYCMMFIVTKRYELNCKLNDNYTQRKILKQLLSFIKFMYKINSKLKID